MRAYDPKNRREVLARLAAAHPPREAYTETESFFRASIEAAQRRREIRRSVDAAETARTLLGLLLGLRVLARASAPCAVLDSIVAQVAQLI